MPRVVSQRVHLWPGGPFSERALTLESSLTEELIRGAGGPWRVPVSRATGWRRSGARDRSLKPELGHVIGAAGWLGCGIWLERRRSGARARLSYAAGAVPAGWTAVGFHAAAGLADTAVWDISGAGGGGLGAYLSVISQAQVTCVRTGSFNSTSSSAARSAPRPPSGRSGHGQVRIT
jgi:hypothetical protein